MDAVDGMKVFNASRSTTHYDSGPAVVYKETPWGRVYNTGTLHVIDVRNTTAQRLLHETGLLRVSRQCYPTNAVLLTALGVPVEWDALFRVPEQGRRVLRMTSISGDGVAGEYVLDAHQMTLHVAPQGSAVLVRSPNGNWTSRHRPSGHMVYVPSTHGEGRIMAMQLHTALVPLVARELMRPDGPLDEELRRAARRISRATSGTMESHAAMFLVDDVMRYALAMQNSPPVEVVKTGDELALPPYDYPYDYPDLSGMAKYVRPETVGRIMDAVQTLQTSTGVLQVIIALAVPPILETPHMVAMGAEDWVAQRVGEVKQ